MQAQITPSKSPTPFRCGRVLRGPVPDDFEAFYRVHLRWRSGRRIAAVELRDRYQAWAIVEERQSVSFRGLKRAMLAIGHRYAHSNGTWYLDVEFSERLPGVPDNFPSAGEGRA